MNKKLLAGMLVALPSAMMGQTAIDAFSISQSDMRGTARFMSMGGAFTALGGDISTLNQNPGGIGVYRSSDISASLDINFKSGKFNAGAGSNSWNHTDVACNNFGYIGTVNLGSSSVMPFFNWGVSYSRVASFDRRFRGTFGSIDTSLSNFVADNTNRTFLNNGGIPPQQMQFVQGSDYNPYWDDYNGNPYAPWLSTLMYTAGVINPISANSSTYTGLYDYQNSSAVADIEVEEKGHVDEYAIDFGGNISDVVFWGIGFGITDVDFRSRSYYSESINNALVPASAYDGGTVTGTADYTLANYKHIYGSGFNFKAGLIIKPVNEFRLGIAVHTPTYYNLSYEGSGQVGYYYDSPEYNKPVSGTAVTDDQYMREFDWRCRTPWRLMVGAAGVIGGRAIISADYEYRASNDIKVQDYDGNNYSDVNGDIKNYYQASNILRLGLEYRVTPQVSLRAGYSYESSPVTTTAMDGYTTKGQAIDANYVYTSGPDDTETQPSYSFDKSTQYVTCGIGYRYKNVYADLAYVHRHRSSKFNAFSNYNEFVTDYYVPAPTGKVSDDNNSLVLTVGVRF